MKNTLKNFILKSQMFLDAQFDCSDNKLKIIIDTEKQVTLDTNNQRALLIDFVDEIMGNKEYHDLENIDIVEKYTRSKINKLDIKHKAKICHCTEEDFIVHSSNWFKCQNCGGEIKKLKNIRY